MPNRRKIRIRQRQKANLNEITSGHHKTGVDEEYEKHKIYMTEVTEKTQKMAVKEDHELAEMFSKEDGIDKFLQKMQNVRDSAKSRTAAEHMKLLKRGGDVEDIFSEGDQSPVSGFEAMVLDAQWAERADYNPLGAIYMSDWSRCCFTGDIESIKKWIETDATVMEYRESIMRMCGILHVIAGSRLTLATNYFTSEMKRKMDYEGALEYLIDKGANIQSRDFAGQSPLHQCLAGEGKDTPVSFKLAKILLKRGADPNAINRFGRTPAFTAAKLGKLHFVELLLDNGAKMNVKDNDGCWFLNTANTYPDLHHMFVKAMTKEGKDQKAEARALGTYRKCAVCGKDKKSLRCSGCFIKWYCGVECQEQQWKDHKEDCKRTQEEYKKVTLDKKANHTTVNHKEKIFESAKPLDTTKKQHFLVKITIPLEDDVSSYIRPEMPKVLLKRLKHPINGGLLIYDRDRHVHGVIPKTAQYHSDIVKKVKAEGVAGVKGYFYAILKDGEISVNISQIQPPENF